MFRERALTSQELGKQLEGNHDRKHRQVRVGCSTTSSSTPDNSPMEKFSMACPFILRRVLVGIWGARDSICYPNGYLARRQISPRYTTRLLLS